MGNSNVQSAKVVPWGSWKTKSVAANCCRTRLFSTLKGNSGTTRTSEHVWEDEYRRCGTVSEWRASKAATSAHVVVRARGPQHVLHLQKEAIAWEIGGKAN